MNVKQLHLSLLNKNGIAMTLSVTMEPNGKHNLCSGLQGKHGMVASFQATAYYYQIETVIHF